MVYMRINLILVSILLLIATNEVYCKGDVHRCVHSTTKLAKRGRGDTDSSCMGCNPAKPTCSFGCQKLIDKVYENCDDVCLPYGYYFDPQWELQGCWPENIHKVKIKVERCGCNAGFKFGMETVSFLSITLLVSVVALFNSLYI